MSTQRYLIGNWKMYLSVSESASLMRALVDQVGGDLHDPQVIVAVCPSLLALPGVAAVMPAAGNIQLGAQDIFWETRGAYTGGTSPQDIKTLGCRYILIGHSERRQYFGETDDMVTRKVHAAHSAGLVPIVCVGETESERGGGLTDEVVIRQVRAARSGSAGKEAIIAYEPRWAIGTGRTVEPREAARVAALIKKIWNSAVIYGGSVQKGNIALFCAEPEIDGVLPGGASTDAEQMRAMARAISFN